eukprot:4102916-Amphidinium_carterae.1
MHHINDATNRHCQQSLRSSPNLLKCTEVVSNSYSKATRKCVYVCRMCVCVCVCDPGPDCGNVKQIIGKWQKAGKIGSVAGQAEGTLSQAKHTAE